MYLLPESYRSKSEVTIVKRDFSNSTLDWSATYEFLDVPITALFLKLMSEENLRVLLAEYQSEVNQLEYIDIDDLVQELSQSIRLDFIYTEKEVEGYWAPVRISDKIEIVVDSELPDLSAYLANRMAEKLVLLFEESYTAEVDLLLDEVNSRRLEISSLISAVDEELLSLERRHEGELGADRVRKNRLLGIQERYFTVEREITFLENLRHVALKNVEKFSQINDAENKELTDAALLTLSSLESVLEQLVGLFGDNHPDVIQHQEVVSQWKSFLGIEEGSSSLNLLNGLAYRDYWSEEVSDIEARISRQKTILVGLSREVERESLFLLEKSKEESNYRRFILEKTALLKELKKLGRIARRIVYNQEIDAALVGERLQISHRGGVSAKPLFPNVAPYWVLFLYIGIFLAVLVNKTNRSGKSILSKSDLEEAAGDCVLCAIPKI